MRASTDSRPSGLAARQVRSGFAERWPGFSGLARFFGAGRPDPIAIAPKPDEETWLREATGDLVTWHGRDGDVLRASGAALALTGRHPVDLGGLGLYSHIHIPDRPAYLKALSDAANGQGSVSVEFRIAGHAKSRTEARERRPAGLLWVEMRAHPVAGRPGACPGATVVAVTRDASASHRQADEIETARLEAVQASEMKGRFLATVSHELRTPLNAIIGFSELLSAEHPYIMAEERRKEYAAIIRDSGHHLLEVVNTLLDISKIETGNFTVAPELFSLTELAHGCCELIGLRAEEAGIRLCRHIPADLPDLLADRRACRQILINLLSNAVKFTPAGGTVTVRISRDGDRTVLAVSDDGIGIREADLPRLGDPFFQVGELHRRPHEGTGLGLSVVRGLVGLHRGEMSIESGPGLGTTVTVTLPQGAAARGQDGRPVVVQTRARGPAVERRIA